MVAAGPTREYLDPVRFLSNPSTGQMGYALAQAAQSCGASVTLISGPVDLAKPPRVKRIDVVSAAEMYRATIHQAKTADMIIMAAAVADYTPVRVAKTKMKKTDSVLTIKLKPTADILKWAGKHKKKNQIVVGFALEDKNLRAPAEKKLKEKNLDMIIANSPAAIGADKSTVQIKTPTNKWTRFPQATKTTIAKIIIGQLEYL